MKDPVKIKKYKACLNPKHLISLEFASFNPLK